MKNENSSAPYGEITISKKRNRGLIIAVVALSLALIAALSGLIGAWTSRNSYRTKLEYVYEREYYELMDAADNLEMTFSKLLISSSDEQAVKLSIKAYNHAECALLSLTKLPAPKDEVADMEKFFNQAADWSLCYSSCVLSKRDSRSYADTVEEMYIAARQVKEQIISKADEIQNSGKDLISYGDGNLKRGESGDDTRDSELKEQSVDYPELIYDGPFSESTTNRCFKGLEGKDEITKEQAEALMREKLGLSGDRLEFMGLSESNASAYEFLYRENETEIYASISKKGGMFLNLDIYRGAENADNSIGEERAKEKARQYAKEYGYDVEAVWYNESDGVALVNLAPVKDGVIYYTDLVKSKICLSSGELLGLEATGFCMNSKERSLTPKMTADAAKSCVSKKLSVKDAKLALVPESERETLCYMVSAEYKGLDYFVFIDADNGREVNIMRVIDDSQGNLVV